MHRTLLSPRLTTNIIGVPDESGTTSVHGTSKNEVEAMAVYLAFEQSGWLFTDNVL